MNFHLSTMIFPSVASIVIIVAKMSTVVEIAVFVAIVAFLVTFRSLCGIPLAIFHYFKRLCDLTVDRELPHILEIIACVSLPIADHFSVNYTFSIHF